MNLPVKKLQYALVDALYNFHYVDNGIVKKQPFQAFDQTPFLPFLPQHPHTWKEFQISFDLFEKYWQSRRSYGIPLTFVGDGATIIKDRQINGKGYSEELYLLLLVQGLNTTKYFKETMLKIDFTQFSDDPVRGVTVNVIEGGALSYLSSRDTSTYELVFDETNPDIIRVRFDGITLKNKFNFQVVPGIQLNVIVDAPNVATLPMIFLNNEGDSVGTITGDQSGEDANGGGYFSSSSNYSLDSIFGLTLVRIFGTIKFSQSQTDFGNWPFGVKYKTSLGNEGVLLPSFLYVSGRSYTFDTGYVINLAPNERIFFCAFISTGTEILLTAADASYIYVEANSRNTTTDAFALRPLAAWKQLVLLMTDGKFTGDSAFLAIHNNICLTCGDAIRNTSRAIVPNYKGAMTVEGFFRSLSSIYNLAIIPVNDVLYIEPKSAYPFNADNQIFDLGEVTDLFVDCATNLLVNLIKCGYPDQSYDSTSASVSGGKYEVNSTQEWNLPTTAVNKVLDISSIFRADPRGIESIRGGLLNKDSTDNDGDKEIFMVNVSDQIIGEDFIATQADVQVFTGAAYIPFGFYAGVNFDWGNPEKTSIVFTSDYQTGSINVYLNINYGGKLVAIDLYQNGIPIGGYSGTDTTGVNQVVISATNVIFHNGDVFRLYLVPFDLPTDWTLNNAVFNVDFTDAVYQLKRVDYTALIGVIDNTIYNVEEMTPHRQLLAWKNYWAALLYQQPTDSVTLNTAAKNALLSTTYLDGTIITENAPEIVGNYINTALFLPYMFRFKTKVPYTYSQILGLMLSGFIKFSFNGVTINCLPFGRMSAKPGTNEAQDWELLAAPNNSLADFLKISTFGLYIIDQDNSMFISDYNSIHWVKYAYTPQAQYHYKDMYEDWSYARFTRYYSKPIYFQKWQTNDTPSTQVFTKGIPGVSIFVYDSAGKYVADYPLDPTVNSALPSTYTLFQKQVSLATFPVGKYLFVLRSAGGQNLAISEWQDIRVDQPKTYLHQYSSTYNKINAFFNTWGQIQFRCESIFGITDPNSNQWEYEDEPGNVEMLNAVPFETQKMVIGDPVGVPEWVGKKINIASLLNQYFVEGKWMSRSLENKLEINFRNGYPFNIYSVELRPARNQFGLTIVGTEELADEDITSYMLDQQAIGILGEGTLDVEITNQ